MIAIKPAGKSSFSFRQLNMGFRVINGLLYCIDSGIFLHLLHKQNTKDNMSTDLKENRTITAQELFHKCVYSECKTYASYEEAVKKLERKIRKFQLLSTLPGVISPLSLFVAFVSSDGSIRVVMVALTVVLALATFIWRIYIAKTQKAQEQAIEEKFHKECAQRNGSCCKDMDGNQELL